VVTDWVVYPLFHIRTTRQRECYRKDLQIHDLNNNFVSTKNITFSSIKECSEKRNEYSRARDYSYGVLNEELSNNLDSVSSTSTANADLDWQAGTCRSGEGGVGIYNFTVRPSKFRKYRNRTINLPLSYATTKVYVPYGCHAEFGSIYFKPHNLENVSTLRTTIDQRYFKLIQNETFTCLFARRFFEDFCFSNSTSSVRRLYRSYSAYGKFRPLVQVYLYAEFEPPVDVSRMYFILAGMRNYQPLNVELSAGVLTVSRSFSVEGNVLTLLTAMEEVLSPQGRNVISISHKRVVATIDKVGFAYLGLLSSVTLTTFLIAIIYICIAKKDARGRVVTVKSEPKYVIDLVANNIMESEDFAAPEVSEFGIALTSHGPDLHRICISRAGVVYKGGIVSGRPEQTHTRRRKRKRSSE